MCTYVTIVVTSAELRYMNCEEKVLGEIHAPAANPEVWKAGKQ